MGDPFWRVITGRGLDVPPAVMALHQGMGERRFEGRADVTRGSNPLVRVALWAAGFPPKGRDVPLVVTIQVQEHHAAWERDFDGHTLRSKLWYDARRGAVAEKLGPFRLIMEVHAEAGALRVDVAGFSFLGVPLPRWMHPISETREAEDSEGRFTFDVSGRMPGLGLIIRYKGYLRPILLT